MLVDAQAKCGSLVEATLQFEKMAANDVVSWDSIIFAYAQMGGSSEALLLYEKMQQQDSLRDERTLVGVLTCGSLQNWRRIGEEAVVAASESHSLTSREK